MYQTLSLTLTSMLFEAKDATPNCPFETKLEEKEKNNKILLLFVHTNREINPLHLTHHIHPCTTQTAAQHIHP